MARGCTIQMCSHTWSQGGLPCPLPSKTKQNTNHRGPSWQKIWDRHSAVKNRKLGYFLTWQLSPVWKAKYRKNMTPVWSTSVLRFKCVCVCGGGRFWSVLNENSREWWWYKKQSLQRIWKGRSSKLHTALLPATLCDLLFTQDPGLADSLQNRLHVQQDSLVKSRKIPRDIPYLFW